MRGKVYSKGRGSEGGQDGTEDDESFELHFGDDCWSFEAFQ